MALYDTVANIVNDVAVECGLGSVSDAFASTNANVIQLRTLLKSVGRGLVLRHPWLQSVKEHTFTTTSASSYALPADFQTMIDQSGWNRTSIMPLQPASPQEWQYLNAAADGAVTWTVIFKPHDTTLELWPQPPVGGEVIAFEYLSRYWVQSDGESAPDKDAPTANTDTVCLDVQLITRALKLAFLRAKGFPSDAAQVEFEQAFADVAAANVLAAPVLSLRGKKQPEVHGDNGFAVGATGFGYNGEGGLY